MLLGLPAEVWVEVLVALGRQPHGGGAVLRFALTCRTAHALVADSRLWRLLCVRYLGLSALPSPTRNAAQESAETKVSERDEQGEVEKDEGRQMEEWKRLWFSHVIVGPRKPHVRAVLLGHIDSGKSTVLGRILADLGAVSRADKAMQDDPRWRYARLTGWCPIPFFSSVVNDAQNSPDALQTLHQLETPHCQLSVSDFSTFRTSLATVCWIVGISNCAVLVVSASMGEFEAGICRSGQTREHLQLAYEAGIEQVVIAVNKLDDHATPALRWDEMAVEMGRLAARMGYAKEKLTMVPISGREGDNICVSSSAFAWYQGPSLLEIIESYHSSPSRKLEQLRLALDPCMISVLGIGKEGESVVGYVHHGAVKKGDRLFLVPRRPGAEPYPVSITGITDTIFQDKSSATPGDILLFSFLPKGNFNTRGVSPIALCSIKPEVVDECRVEVASTRSGLNGTELVLHCLGVSAPCSLRSKADDSSTAPSEVVKARNREIVTLRFQPDKALSTAHIAIGRPVTLHPSYARVVGHIVGLSTRMSSSERGAG